MAANTFGIVFVAFIGVTLLSLASVSDATSAHFKPVDKKYKCDVDAVSEWFTKQGATQLTNPYSEFVGISCAYTMINEDFPPAKGASELLLTYYPNITETVYLTTFGTDIKNTSYPAFKTSCDKRVYTQRAGSILNHVLAFKTGTAYFDFSCSETEEQELYYGVSVVTIPQTSYKEEDVKRATHWLMEMVNKTRGPSKVQWKHLNY